MKNANVYLLSHRISQVVKFFGLNENANENQKLYPRALIVITVELSPKTIIMYANGLEQHVG